MTETEPSDSSITAHPRTWRPMLPVALGSAFVGAVLLAVLVHTLPERATWRTLLLVISALLSFSTAWLVSRLRVVVDAAGVHEYVTLGGTTTTLTWPEIARIDPGDAGPGGNVVITRVDGSEHRLPLARRHADALRDRQPAAGEGVPGSRGEPFPRTWRPHRRSSWVMWGLVVTLFLVFAETRQVSDNGPAGGLVVIGAVALALTATARSRLRVRTDAEGLHLRRPLQLGEATTRWRQISRIATEPGRGPGVAVETMAGERLLVPVPAWDVGGIRRWHDAR